MVWDLLLEHLFKNVHGKSQASEGRVGMVAPAPTISVAGGGGGKGRNTSGIKWKMPLFYLCMWA